MNHLLSLTFSRRLFRSTFRLGLLSLGLLSALLLPTAAIATTVSFSVQAPGAQAVYLAGTFNSWNPTGQLMTDDDGDGIFAASLELAPGKYLYKFVIDGNWTEDPTASEFVDDNFGGKNSVVEVGDQALVLGPAGSTSSQEHASKRPAEQNPEGALEKAHPNAPEAVSREVAIDRSGVVRVSFRCEAPGAQAVYLAGEFNDWNPTGQAMKDADGDGVFETALDLAPGKYAYKFVIDGDWKEDPAASEFVDDGFGGKNSVVTVTAQGVMAGRLPGSALGASEGKMNGGDEKKLSAAPKTPIEAPNKAVPAAPPGQRLVRFVASASPGAHVFLAGEFNGWDPSGRRMEDPDGDGNFETVLPLAFGKYAYKFVIDGNWKEDPAAAEFVDDGFGGKNSVVEVAEGEGIQDAGEAGTSTGAAGTSSTQTGENLVTPGPSPGSGTVEGLRSVRFSYQPVIGGVKDVFLAGTFNDWNVGSTPMTDADGDGVWETTLLLAPGEYQYKFVADGNWITDEKADSFADDGFGGKNSVIKVDARFATIDVAKGDGEFYLEGLDLHLDYATVNEIEPGHVILQARSHLGDVESVVLLLRQQNRDAERLRMQPGARDAVFQTWTTDVSLAEPDSGFRFSFAYHDGDAVRYALGGGGFAEEEPPPTDWMLYTRELLPPFQVPDWAQQAVYYQIFPDRFRNGDPSNDQDFHEAYYEGKKSLPPSGKTNGEYFHFVSDWNDIAGLKRSPYRTDGKPDYYSFYGGDIAGVMQELDYLQQLGVTVIYFNPITDARSNHRYDPCDYLKLDPHLGREDEFRSFSAAALEHGIRVIVDMAYNHTGDCHFAFQDVIAHWKDSEYYDWYEWKKRPPSYPLPAGAKAIDYYDCWWGFGLHPNLNYDLSRPNAQENNISDIADAEPNWPMVNYVLDSVDYWLGEMGCSGFRLDVPNEVPFWFWKLFRERCRKVKPEHVLIGEIWGDAGAWIGPDVFDAVMNYRSFKDPVVKWIGQHQGSATSFDRELAGGRSRYPLQAVRAQMNLVDSHDTVRFLQVATEDIRRLRLAATFAMTYVGSPHIYYGDELGLTGGKDPDCRRTMPWDQIEAPARKETLEHYRKVAGLRQRYPALSQGDFRLVLAKGEIYAYLREHEGQRVLVALNNGTGDATVMLPVGNVGVADTIPLDVLLGDPATLAGASGPLEVKRGMLRLSLPPVEAAILEIGSSRPGR